MRGMEGIRKLEKYAAPVLIVLTSALLAWAYTSAGGFGRVLTQTPRLTSDEFWKLFFPSLTANISFWATVAINIPDFARYARSQADQVLGQVGLPVFMGLYTFAGLAITSATEAIFGHVISDPIELLGRIGGLATTFLAIFGIGLATITTNIAANVVAPANALVSMSPRRFTFAKGRHRVDQPRLPAVAAGRGSPYYFQGGFNVAAMVAMAAGMAPIVPGFLHKVGVLTSVSKAFVMAYNNACSSASSSPVPSTVYSAARERCKQNPSTIDIDGGAHLVPYLTHTDLYDHLC
ncbi:hypothetical protein C2845_PM11G30810 [Panicum miliaceum]|uniref:Uncharacterized protein n=1 Tax=Panicum miliaceum TaxID=4540 RepID=A0A3L6RX50_PANMI|nr:hypothetical protein C2845_PM11G30810 [Panicum miliaceum]